MLLDEALPSGFDYSADKCQTSPADQMPERVARIIERCEKIDARINALEDKMQHIRDSINAMNDHDSMRLLWLRYIEGRDWEEVADVMGVTVSHAKGYIHGAALDKWDKVNTN